MPRQAPRTQPVAAEEGWLARPRLAGAPWRPARACEHLEWVCNVGGTRPAPMRHTATRRTSDTGKKRKNAPHATGHDAEAVASLARYAPHPMRVRCGATALASPPRCERATLARRALDQSRGGANDLPQVPRERWARGASLGKACPLAWGKTCGRREKKPRSSARHKMHLWFPLPHYLVTGERPSNSQQEK